MSRVAELEREVAHLRKRVEVTRHVVACIALHVDTDSQMIALVVDDVIEQWALDPGRDLDDVWRQYVNRIEWADAELGTMRPDMCELAGLSGDASGDIERYFEQCWIDHIKTLRLAALVRAAA